MVEDIYNLAGRMWQLYVSDVSKCVLCADGKIWTPKQKATSDDLKVKRKPLCLNMLMIRAHLRGAYNVAVFASQKSSKFICIDVDYNDYDLLRQVMNTLVSMGFDRKYIHPSISGGKGFHVEIFFEDRASNKMLRKLYEGFLLAGGFDRHKVEFRPTATQAVRLPLSNHYKTGVMGWYLDPETLEPIEDRNYIFQIATVPLEVLDAVVDRIKLPKQRKATRKLPRVDGDALELIAGLPVITGPGQRHAKMVGIALFQNDHGRSSDEIYKILMAWVATQNRSFISSTDAEIEADAAELADWAVMQPRRAIASDRPYGRSVFDAEDINYILNGGTKTERRLLFLHLLLTKIWSKNNMKQRLMAWALGTTQKTIHDALVSIRDKGLIEIYEGKRVHSKFRNGPARLPNTYATGKTVAQVLDAADMAAKYWDLGEVLVWRKFLWYYANMMTAMLDDKLVKYVKKSEADEIAKIIAAGEPIIEEDEEIADEEDMVESNRMD